MTAIKERRETNKENAFNPAPAPEETRDAEQSVTKKSKEMQDKKLQEQQEEYESRKGKNRVERITAAGKEIVYE